MKGSMMKSRALVFGLAVVGVLIFSQASQAQVVNTYGFSDNPVGPTVSPYLNLVNQDFVDPNLTNYQSLVRPLLQQNNAINRQGSAINRLQQQYSAPASGAAGGATGHTTFFMNGSHYFPSGIR